MEVRLLGLAHRVDIRMSAVARLDMEEVRSEGLLGARYPKPGAHRMNTGRGIFEREADGRSVPYNAAQLVDAISPDHGSGYQRRCDLEITFDDDALKNPRNAPAEARRRWKTLVSAGEGVRGDVVRGEGAGPTMWDRRCPSTHRHG